MAIDNKYYKDNLDILGLKEGATEQDINKAFRANAMKYHPDKNNDKSEAEQNDAAKKFEAASRAKEFLLAQLRNGHAQDKQNQDKQNNDKKQHQNKQNQDKQKPKNNTPKLPLPDFMTMAAALDILSNGLGKLEIVRNTRPAWIESKKVPDYGSTAVVCADNSAIVPKQDFERFKYTRQYEDGSTGVATLDRSQEVQRITFDASSEASIKATVELAKGARWEGMSVPSNLSKEKLDLFAAECKKHNIVLSTYYVPENILKLGSPSAPKQIEAPPTHEPEHPRMGMR